MKNSPFYQLQH